MKRPGSGTLSLLIVAALFAAGVGAWVGLFHQSPEPALRAGAPAPDFALPLEGGGQVSLAALRGKVVFVNFWATWCAPCRMEAPSLQRLSMPLRGDGFEVLGISIDAAQTARRSAGSSATSRSTSRSRSTPQAGLRELPGQRVPETYLVDGEGKILERFIGPQNWDDPRYVREIRRALAAAGTRSGGSPGGS